MSILKTLEDLVGTLDWVKIDGDVLFIELDIINYDDLDEEIGENYTILAEQTIPDIGKGKILNFMGHKFIITSNKKAKVRLDSFYVAFKIKINGGIQDQSGSKTQDDS